MTQHRFIESKKTVFRDLKERPLMRKDLVPTEPGTYSDRNHDLWTTEGYAANPHYWTSAVYLGKTRPTWAMADLAPFMRFGPRTNRERNEKGCVTHRSWTGTRRTTSPGSSRAVS